MAGTIERKRDDAEEIAQRRAQAKFAELCGSVVAIVDALPPNIAAELRTAASTAFSWPARPGSPLWTQRLARCYSTWLEGAERSTISK